MSTVNPFDCAVRAGYMAVGSGVSDFAPGNEVYGRAGIFRDGGNADCRSFNSLRRKWPMRMACVSNLSWLCNRLARCSPKSPH